MTNSWLAGGATRTRILIGSSRSEKGSEPTSANRGSAANSRMIKLRTSSIVTPCKRHRRAQVPQVSHIRSVHGLRGVRFTRVNQNSPDATVCVDRACSQLKQPPGLPRFFLVRRPELRTAPVRSPSEPDSGTAPRGDTSAGVLLATHAAVALFNRGILMASHRITGDQAFGVLRRYSVPAGSVTTSALRTGPPARSRPNGTSRSAGGGRGAGRSGRRRGASHCWRSGAGPRRGR